MSTLYWPVESISQRKRKQREREAYALEAERQAVIASRCELGAGLDQSRQHLKRVRAELRFLRERAGDALAARIEASERDVAAHGVSGDPLGLPDRGHGVPRAARRTPRSGDLTLEVAQDQLARRADLARFEGRAHQLRVQEGELLLQIADAEHRLAEAEAYDAPCD